MCMLILIRIMPCCILMLCVVINQCSYVFCCHDDTAVQRARELVDFEHVRVPLTHEQVQTKTL